MRECREKLAAMQQERQKVALDMKYFLGDDIEVDICSEI